MKKKRLVVIGGGAAGFFCAINAAQMNPELEVIILEKSSKLLSKVRVSGGGRCNVTHDCTSIAEMIKKYPKIVKGFSYDQIKLEFKDLEYWELIELEALIKNQQ